MFKSKLYIDCVLNKNSLAQSCVCLCRCLWCLIWRRLPVVASWCSWSATKKSWWSWDAWSRRWRASLCLHPHPLRRAWGQQLCRGQHLCQAPGGVGWAAVGYRPCRPLEVLLLQVRHLFFLLRNYLFQSYSILFKWPCVPGCTESVRFQP